MVKIDAAYATPGRGFLSLKWKSFIALSLVLVTVNASLAYLVFARATHLLGAGQTERREAQVRELQVVLDKGMELVSTFSSFVPLLSTPKLDQGADRHAQLISAVLAKHGLLLTVEWGVEGIHFFAAGELSKPSVSWPQGRPVPPVEESLRQARLDETPQGQLLCDAGCYQVVTLPLLQQGRTMGHLVVERSIADTLREFYLLSGADIALMGAATKRVLPEQLRLSPWSRDIPVITHAQNTLPLLQGLSEVVDMQGLLAGVQRIQLDAEWYEVYTKSAGAHEDAPILLLINRVTEQVRSVRDATRDSLILGLVGLLASEFTLLLLMWGPMQRIQDTVAALPLLAEKSFIRLRHALPSLAEDRSPRDEIDVMVKVVRQVSGQIEALDDSRSAAEEALRQSEQGLQLAQSMARVASWVGYPLQGTFELVQGAEHIDQALEGVRSWSSFMSLVHPEDRRDLIIAWRRGHVEKTMDIEFRLNASGRCIDVHVMAQFEYLGPSRVLRAKGMMQDITATRSVQRLLQEHRDRLERQVAERTLELEAARNRAERLARAKGEFLAHMSHELRTPMSAVLGFSEIGLRDSHNRAIAETFRQIQQAGEHLLQVVNDVLDVSKLDAGTLSVETVPYQVRGVVNAGAQMLSLQAELKGLQLRVKVADDVPEYLLGDGHRVQQILINLIGNALKFTSAGSVSVAVYLDAGQCCFRVRDTGIGMSAEQLGQLFRPYRQFENGLTSRHEGTGLGLNISQRLAVLMGGRILVHSEPGSGSEFVLRMPMREAAGTPDPGTPEPAAPGCGQRLSGLRVLVADDAEVNRAVVRALLESEGARVTAVNNGAEAVATLGRDQPPPFDIVFMDVQMPGMDGRQATRAIRNSLPGLPVIGLTAHVSVEEREQSLASGMNEQLVKPVLRDQLVDVTLRCVAA